MATPQGAQIRREKSKCADGNVCTFCTFSGQIGSPFNAQVLSLVVKICFPVLTTDMQNSLYGVTDLLIMCWAFFLSLFFPSYFFPFLPSFFSSFLHSFLCPFIHSFRWFQTSHGTMAGPLPLEPKQAAALLCTMLGVTTVTMTTPPLATLPLNSDA